MSASDRYWLSTDEFADRERECERAECADIDPDEMQDAERQAVAE